MIKLIIDLIIGAIIGSIAGKIMETGKNGFWMNALYGIGGGFIGGLIGNLLHIGSGWLVHIVLSVIGACLVIFIIKKLKES